MNLTPATLKTRRLACGRQVAKFSSFFDNDNGNDNDNDNDNENVILVWIR